MDGFYARMVVVRIRKPAVSVSTDKAVKPVAYGFASKPSTDPSYPVTVAQINGKGRYRLLIVGDGDESAVFRVYVDGSTTPVDQAESNVPAIVEGTFNTGVQIKIEGTGLHSAYTYEVFVEQDYVTAVSVS